MPGNMLAKSVLVRGFRRVWILATFVLLRLSIAYNVCAVMHGVWVFVVLALRCYVTVVYGAAIHLRDSVYDRRIEFDLDDGVVFNGVGFKTNEVSATFVVLCRDEELYEMLDTIQNIEDRFNHAYGYDYVFLNDKQFSRRFMEHVVSLVNKNSRISFGKVPRHHWLYPETIDIEFAHQQRSKMEAMGVLYGGSESYRHMCRYFSGFFYKHPLVQDYQYYWRLEPGTKVLCDVQYDIFVHMLNNKKKYGFVISLFEYRATIPTLWSHFRDFLSLHPELKSLGMLPFVENDDVARSYNLCHFWSNLEIADFSLFRNPVYEQFFEHLEAQGGFFYERWGDAPVHTLAVSMLLEPSEVWFIDDLGYSHEPYTMCPKQLDSHLTNRCVCDPSVDFTDSYLSCTPHFLKIAAEYHNK